VRRLPNEVTLTYSQISLQDLPHFISILPFHVARSIKTIGILNNCHILGNLGNIYALAGAAGLTALRNVMFVPRGGVRDDKEKKIVMDAMADPVLRHLNAFWKPMAE